MQFETIRIRGGQPDQPDPRLTPPSDDSIRPTPPNLVWTDESPTVVVLTLEGTPGQSCQVQQWILDEPREQKPQLLDDPTLPLPERRFYQFGNPILVVVGIVTLARAFPGKVFYRVVGAPAADALLKVGFKSGAHAESGGGGGGEGNMALSKLMSSYRA